METRTEGSATSSRVRGEPAYRPALAVDISEWDDPDYEFLAFKGRDRPFRDRELRRRARGEVDKVLASYRSGKAHASRGEARPRCGTGSVDARQELGSLREEIEDLGEPVQEFATFDQCMHVIGVTEYGSRAAALATSTVRAGPRPAFAMDMRGFDPPEYQLFAFPGEEPPSIECNEDAGGLFTN